MSKNTLIASRLINSVRERAMIPDDDIVYDNEAILNILNEKLSLEVVETILDLNEEHLVYSEEIFSTGTIVIPHRALGSKLRDLHFYWGGTNAIVEMRRIDLGEIADYSYGMMSNLGSGFDERSRYVFYVEGDEIKTLGNMAGRYKMYYHMRPNTIVEEDTCAKITSIDRGTGIIQFNEIPREFVELSVCDFIQNHSPNKILGLNIPVLSVNISQRTITVSPDRIPSRLSEGDWVCDEETSPYPNIPSEVHTYLAQAAAVQILEAVGDSEMLNNARVTLEKIMKKSVQKIMNNRVEGANRKIKI